MKFNQVKRLLAGTLSAAMIFTSLPTHVLAEEVTEAAQEAVEAYAEEPEQAEKTAEAVDLYDEAEEVATEATFDSIDDFDDIEEFIEDEEAVEEEEFDLAEEVVEEDEQEAEILFDEEEGNEEEGPKYRINFDFITGGREFVFDNDQIEIAVDLSQLSELEGYSTAYWMQYYDGDDAFEIKDAVKYDENRSVLTIDGSVLMETRRKYGIDGADIFFVAYTDNNSNGAFDEEEAITGEAWGIGIRDDVRDDHLPFKDETVKFLPDDWDGIGREDGDVYIEDADHPFGQGFPISISDVNVVSGEDIIGIRNWDNDEGWEFYPKSGDFGTATLQVTYTDIDGSSKNYTFDVVVSGSRYLSDLDTENGSNMFIKGTKSFDVFAHLSHDTATYNEKDNNWERFTQDGILDEASIEWSLAGDPDAVAVATIENVELVSGDPDYQARITLEDTEMNDFDFGVVFTVKVDGKVVETNSYWVEVHADYYELEPINIDSQLGLGEKVTVSPKVYHNYIDDKGDVQKNLISSVRYEIANFDPDQIKVTDKDGVEVGKYGDDGYNYSPGSSGDDVSFTIEHIDRWGSDIRIVAFFAHEDSENQEDYSDERDAWLRIDEIETGEVWFDPVNGETLYNDGNLEVNIDTTDLADKTFEYTLDAEMGILGDNDQWEFDPIKGNIVNDDNQWKLILDGKALWETFKDYGFIHVKLKAYMDGLDEPFFEHFIHINFNEASEDYDQYYDAQMLVGWDETIDGQMWAWISNSEYPEGYQFTYNVSDVEIVSQDPWEEGNDVIEDFHRDNDGDNYWWYYRAINGGSVTFKVTYLDIEGVEKSYEFKRWVVEDFWQSPIEILEGNNNDQVMLGESLTLKTTLYRFSVEGYDLNEYDYEYEWVVPEDSEGIITVEQDKNDPTIAKVYTGEKAEKWSSGRVELHVYRLNSDGSRHKWDDGDDAEVSFDERWININGDFWRMTPEIDRELQDLLIGETVVINPTTTHYYFDENDVKHIDSPETILYSWDWDPAVLEITAGDGTKLAHEKEDGSDTCGVAPFTIKRLNYDGTGVTFFAEYDDKEADDIYEVYNMHAYVNALNDEDVANILAYKINNLSASSEKSEVDNLLAAKDALTSEQKKIFDEIEGASDTVAKLNDAEKASGVASDLNALDPKSGVAAESKVNQAEAAYNALTDAQKKLVSQEAVENLNAAKASVKAAKDAANKAAADDVVKKINALPAKPGKADEAAVNAARKAYDALSADQKKLVTNVSKLTAAEQSVTAAKNETTLTVTAKGLKNNKVTLKKGKSLKLKATSNKKVTFKSNKTKVVTVTKKGKIKAKKAGSAKITVTAGDKKIVIKVKVKK